MKLLLLFLQWILQLNVLYLTVISINSLQCIVSLSICNNVDYIVMKILVLTVHYQVHLFSYKFVIFVILNICISSFILLLYRFAACVYSGNETKFGMNKKVPQMKLTKSDIMINWFTVLIFCFQV